MRAGLMLRRALLAVSVLAIGACATPPAPPARLGLKLDPAALGASIGLQQHLRVERGGRIDELDAALEIDPQHVELIGLAFGRRVLRLYYDGHALQAWRHPLLPPQIRAEDVLEDLHLTLWPAAAIQRALPAGWRIEEHGLRRTLLLDDVPVMQIGYSGQPRWSGTVILDNLRYGYRLTIQSVPAAP